ncbi:hypothetical protein Lal_00004268, partial [Lupinus albus]
GDDPDDNSYDEGDDANENDDSNEDDDDLDGDFDDEDNDSDEDDEYNEEEFMAIAIYGQYCRLAFCKHGDKKWTDIPKSQKDCDDDCDYDYEDAIFHQGFNSSVSVPAHNVPNGWDNGIHYTDNILPTQSSGVVGGNDIGVFNFEDGKSTQLFPDITLLTPPPVWLL